MARVRLQVEEADEEPGIGPASNDVELGFLERKLLIDKHQLDEELVHQAQTYNEIGSSAALAASQRDEAEDDMERVENELQLDLRREMDEAGTKYTEKSVNAQVAIHARIQKAKKRYREAVLRTKQLEHLRDAFKQRGYALSDLAELFQSGYYVRNSVSVSRNTVDDRDIDDIKKKMAAGRGDFTRRKER